MMRQWVQKSRKVCAGGFRTTWFSSFQPTRTLEGLVCSRSREPKSYAEYQSLLLQPYQPRGNFYSQWGQPLYTLAYIRSMWILQEPTRSQVCNASLFSTAGGCAFRGWHFGFQDSQRDLLVQTTRAKVKENMKHGARNSLMVSQKCLNCIHHDYVFRGSTAFSGALVRPYYRVPYCHHPDFFYIAI